MFGGVIYNHILKNFFRIELSNVENELAIESVEKKYIAATKASFIYGILTLPVVLFIDTTVLVSVIIPITMVAGTAWYAVSLANIKKKFENFGLELTADMFRAFATSLIIIGLLMLVALNPMLFSSITAWGSDRGYVQVIAGLLGTAVVFKLVWDIYAGSMKYDINDTMLAGQSEAAERYFKKSLSLLNSCADNLKKGKNTEVSNYYIGLAFYEIFTYVIATKGYDEEFYSLLKEAEELKSNPGMEREKAEKISIHLIEKFMQFSTNVSDERTKKSIRNIQSELGSLKKNKKESQEMINIRLSVIFEEMGDMLENQGDALFKKRRELEKKFLISSLPEKLESYPHESILQGYLKVSPEEETRIRKCGEQCTHTIKKRQNAGYREEIETFITKDKFEKLWEETKGKRIEKTRYRIPLKGQIIELDVFSGANKGLVVAEVEFNDKNDFDIFQAPSWFSQEVTNDSKYKNQNLAK